MPITFGSSNDGSNKLFIRANLPQNRWWVKTEAGDEQIDMERGFAIDIKNVKFGWLHIDVGVRDWQQWPSTAQQIAKPSENHKQGFEVDCWLADAREAQFSGNSYGLGQFIAKLYNAAEQAPEFAEGKIPVVQVTSSTPIVIGRGTSYDVAFAIRAWIDRPTGDVAAPAAPAPQPVATPAPAAPAPAPTSGATDFGF